MPRFVILLVCFLAFTLPAQAQDSDGIPDNCEYQYGAHYRPALFPRYEPQNQRLLLVDWITGQEVSLLDSSLADTLIRGWSADCRYLAVATGSAAAWDTVVYDTINGSRMGMVPDAHGVPHPITWGPDSLLMVEGRNGAILWNVPRNIQYPLAVGFDPLTVRNFRRLQWDAAEGIVIAQLAVGGQVVVDLATGTLTATTSAEPGFIVLGGERYPCVLDRRRGQGSAWVTSLYLQYAPSGGVAYIGAGHGVNRISAVVLEAGLPPTGLRGRGWSGGCRYIAGALGSTERNDTYDTVIWDVLEQRRVGVFPDARDVPHRLYWDTAERHVLIETREGAYLWDLWTNARVLVNAETIADPTCDHWVGDCAPRSFHHVYWDAGREQMLGVPVQSPDSVVAYNVYTGAEEARYTVNSASEPLTFITSNDSRLLLAYADRRFSLWQRDGGVLASFPVERDPSFNNILVAAISTDNRYLAVDVGSDVLVWDLTTISDNALPFARYPLGAYFGPGVYFLNNELLVMGSPSQARLNVGTGEVTGVPAALDTAGQPVQTYTAVAGRSGWGAFASAAHPQCPIAVRYNVQTRQVLTNSTVTGDDRVLESDVNPVRELWLSPSCTVIYARVPVVNTSLPFEENLPDPAWGSPTSDWLILWDAVSGTRFATLQYDRNSKVGSTRIIWSPDGTHGLLRAVDGYYVVDSTIPAVHRVQFQDNARGWLPTDLRSFWHYERGVVLVSGFGEAFVVDLQTGAERLRFPVQEFATGGCYSAGPRSGCPFTVSEDGTWVFVYGDQSMSVWNLDTLAHAFVPQEGAGGALISPDGRYLAISRSAVRVWDLQNLPTSFEARQPIATFGVGNQAVLSIRFVDNTTLEVITRTAEGTATTLYDAATGMVR